MNHPVIPGSARPASASVPSAALPPIELLDGGTAEWDAFVGGHHEATFCHSAAWRDIMNDALGHECLYAVARNGAGEVDGVLPLVHVRSRILGHYLLSMPFLNYGGPIGSSDAQRRLTVHALEAADREGVRVLELRSRHPSPSGLSDSPRKVTVLLDLPATAAELLPRFPGKLRSQVRKPLKEGMTASFGAEHAAAFYDVFARNMRDLGTPVLPRHFFERVLQALPGHVLFGAVFWNGQPVAAGCGFVWRDEFELTWASSLREHNRRAPNMLLYASFMEHVIARGVRRFNFGRCTPGGGTHNFKLQWGGETVPLPWQAAGQGAAAPPSPDKPVFRLATRVWSRMPLAVANRLGPLLARSLP
jgi:FemAB-related protein (PEP-CTERM system-associated)